jgi:hypothetical protein
MPTFIHASKELLEDGKGDQLTGSFDDATELK